MGEGKRERSSRRRRSIFRTSQKSCSDSEVARTRLKEHRDKSRDQLPWPSLIDVLTVDGLARYRRRRVKNRPEDTLGPGQNAGSFEDIVSEYRRSFRATSEDSLLRDIDTSSGFDPGGRAKTNVALMEVDNNDASSIPGQVPARPPLIRRGTSLKRGGDFYGATEYSNFRFYEGVHRPELARRPTSLRMEGDMRTVTEQCEKFIEWINVSRPELARVPTNLKLEGSQETSTENHDQYVPFVGARRPELLRQGAHLRLEGETTYLPEYTDVFRQPVNREKRTPVFPENHLRPGGEFSESTESTQQFVDPRGTVLMQTNKNQEDNNQELTDEEDEDDEEKRKKKEEEMKYIVSKLEDLKNPPLETPEYKDAFKNYPRERPKLLKPEDEIGLADGSKMHPSPNSARFRTRIDQDPEYKSKYLDQDRPVYRRPPMFSHRPSVGSSNFNKRLVPDLRSSSTSEVRAQYVPYGNVPRAESLRRASALRTEGHMDLQPEYRDAYCRRGSQSRDMRNSRKVENNWTNSENREMFGFKNAEHDQDAFQMVHTKVHEENVVGKPPVARRGSRGAVQPNLLRHRSPSPTYRLHVQNVDDEPRGFARRRSSSVRQTGHSPSPDRMNHNQRSYSPSFGKEKQEAFVVLDQDPRRRRLDRNANIETEVRGRKRTPSNWMPPWYDSSGSV